MVVRIVVGQVWENTANARLAGEFDASREVAHYRVLRVADKVLLQNLQSGLKRRVYIDHFSMPRYRLVDHK